MDRYSILALMIAIMMIVLSSFGLPDNDESIIGFADDINKNDNGFLFYINDCDGNTIRSFCNERPDDSLHSFHGRYSDDGNIFFVSDINDY